MSVDLQMPVRGLPTAIQGSEHWSAPNLRELPVDEAAEVRLHYASSEQIVQPSYPRQSEFSSQAPNLIGRVARLLCGEPNIGLSRWGDLRFGSHGSLSVNDQKGTFYDHEAKEGGGLLDFIERKTGRKGGEAQRWLVENGLLPDDIRTRPKRSSSRRLVAEYDYRESSGEVRYQVVRYAPKNFLQRRPDGHDGWTYSVKGVDALPYRLPEINAAISAEQTIIIVEGEKDADNLARMGVCSTTCAGGAGNWKNEVTPYFKGAHVIIIPDNDVAGRSHAEGVAQQLAAVATSVRLLDLKEHWPACPPKGDISNWIEVDGTREQLDSLLAKATNWVGGGNRYAGERTPKTPKTPAELPVIQLIKGQRAAALDAALEVLRKRVAIFDRGGELVRIAGGRIEPVSEDWLADCLDRHIQFEGLRKRRDAQAIEVCDAPQWLARRIEAKREERGFPELRAVITAPTMRADGSLLNTPGFDPATGLLLVPGDWPRVPMAPSTDELRQAASTLWTPFASFPFVDQTSRSVKVATVLTAAIRQTLDLAPATKRITITAVRGSRAMNLSYERWNK